MCRTIQAYSLNLTPTAFDLSQTRRDGVRVRNLAKGEYKEEVRGYVGTGK